MSSFFDEASLVMIPSGYKNAKVYSVKPTDGTGDLTFSRASSATRVASNGLIEKVRTNVITYSNTFSNAAWTKAGQGVGSVSVVTPNYTTDPFGGNNAWRFQCNLNGGTTSSDRSWMLQAFTPFVDSVLSIYIKLNVAGSKTIILSNGGGEVQTITSTDWVRITKVTAGSSGEFRIGLIGGSTSDTLDCSIAFAQAETGDVATAYIATTTAAVSVGPVSGLPRLDYLGSTCPKLLLEPQRTNLITYSEQLNNAAWVNDQITISANTTISPDGYQNADTATIVTANSNLVTQVITVSASTTYTFSFYVKRGTATDLRYSIYDVTNAANIVAPTTYYSQTSSSQWVRISFTFTTPVGCLSIACYPIRNATSTGTAFLYGCQVEAGAYATSYIPTLGASVTRVNEKASKSSINSLIGGTSGTIFFEIKTNKTLTSTNYKTFVYYTDVSAGQMYLYLDGTNTIITSPTLGNISSSVTLAADNTYKVALAYALNDIKLYINGVERGSSVSATPINALNLLSIGSYDGTAEFNEFTFKQYLHFKTRLTNTQLAELTAL